jgi:CTP:phosphocholine cytidylyltransferase-like protein
MYKAERAIILAAGFGSRLQPLTWQTPKPLLAVNGTPMIATAVEKLHRNGIQEIYVVVGYQKEKFSHLPAEYPGLALVENPYFDTCNNISSLYVAQEHLENAIVLDGDQMIYTPEALSPYFDRSGYNAVWTDKPTQEWLLTVENQVITHCSRTGGQHGWQLYGISRWCADDAKRLRKHLTIEFEQKKNRQIYWDDVALFCYPQEYTLGIHPMQAGDVVEIDSLAELAALDKTYAPFLREDAT